MFGVPDLALTLFQRYACAVDAALPYRARNPFGTAARLAWVSTRGTCNGLDANGAIRASFAVGRSANLSDAWRGAQHRALVDSVVPDLRRILIARFEFRTVRGQVADQWECTRAHLWGRWFANPNEVPRAHNASDLIAVAVAMHAHKAVGTHAMLRATAGLGDRAAFRFLQHRLDAQCSLPAFLLGAVTT